MSLTIHEMPHSPYCIPITRLLTCFGVAFERAEVSAWDRRDLARLTGGRYYQVPVLVDGETVVHETAEDPLAVPHYLDSRYCAGALFPQKWEGLHDLIVDHIESSLEGAGFKLADPFYLDSIQDLGERTMVIRHKERRFGRGCVETWRAEAGKLKAEFETLLHPFEARLTHAPFLFGETPVYADFALYGVIGNYRYKGWNALNPSFKALHAWLERLENWRR